VSLIDLLIYLIIAWIIIYYILVKKVKKYFAPYGPALLIKTQAGVKTIDKVSRTKFWDYFVTFFYYSMPIFGILTVILLIWEAFIILSIPKSAAPPLSYALALPGINPVIPVGFGIVGLIIAVALHEAAHGIAARRFNIPVRSTGLLWFIIPIGAFVEPDENVMRERDSKTRGKIFAAGPGMNVTLAVIFLILAIVLAYSFTPVSGAPVQSSLSPSILPGDIIEKIGNINIKNVSTFSLLSFTPGTNVSVLLNRNGNLISENVTYGVYITGIVVGYPAQEAGIKIGSIILSVNGKEITNITNFENILSGYQAGQTIFVKTLYKNSIHSYNVTLASKYSYLISAGDNAPGIPKTYPFMGIDVSLMGLSLFDQYSYINLLRDPFSSGPLGFFVYLGLPFHYELPLPATLQSSFNANIIVLNMEYLFYWLFWLNFALGLTNILPLVPLDGGYVLLNMPALQKNQKLRNVIVAVIGLSVLFLILWQLIIPRI